MSLRFFHHEVLQQVYALVQPTPDLQWRTIYPNGAPTRFLNLHLYTRQAPDLGRPENECGLVPVQEAMFTAFMKEISLQQAARADLHLVQYVQRIAAYPSLPHVLSQMPCWAKLLLVECNATDTYHLFDVYRVQEPKEKLVCLTSLLAQMFECKNYGGQPRVIVPLRGTSQEAGSLLVQAIEIRLWGTREHAPTYAYEVKC